MVFDISKKNQTKEIYSPGEVSEGRIIIFYLHTWIIVFSLEPLVLEI